MLYPMSLIYLPSFVQAPTVAPTYTASVGSYRFAHRRVNQSGRRSQASPTTTLLSFPITLTPQSYTDTDELLRDEFLVSPDGTNWRVIPRANETGAQTVTAYDPTWAITDLGDNQDQEINSEDLGLFDSDGTEPFTFFVKNTGDSVGLLTANVLDPATNNTHPYLSGLLDINLDGILVESGTGIYSTVYNRSLVWTVDGNNTFPLLLPSGSSAKYTIQLVNRPSTGIPTSSLAFNLQFVSNKKLFPVTFDQGWLKRTLLYQPESGFSFPIVEASITSGSVVINPFAFNYDGTQVVNPRSQTFATTDGDSKLVVYRTGEIGVIPQSTTTPTNSIELVSFTITGTVLSDVSYSVNFNPGVAPRKRNVVSGEPGDFIRISGVDVTQSTDTQVPHGVLLDSSGNYGINGVFLVNSGGTIAVGDAVTSDAMGKAVTTLAGSPFIAVTGSSSGGQVLVETVNVQGQNSTSSITTGDISDYVEATQDLIGASLVAGPNMTVTYNDATGETTLESTGFSGTITSSQVSDFTEASQDVIGSSVIAGPNVTVSYNDSTGQTTISATGTGTITTASITDYQEATEDLIGASVIAGSNVSVSYNDTTGKTTVSSNPTIPSSQVSDFNEAVEDIIGSKVIAGANVTVSYNDTTGETTISASGSGGGITLEDVDDRVDQLIQVPSTGLITKTYNDVANTLTLANKVIEARYTISSNVSAVNGGDLSFNTEVIDTNFSNSTGSLFTISETGTYLLTAEFLVMLSATTWSGSAFVGLHNGTTFLQVAQFQGNSGDFLYRTLAGMHTFTSGTVIRYRIGAASTFTFNASGTFFHILRVR